jgi:type II secretory pathway pseudopilin PulG
MQSKIRPSRKRRLKSAGFTILEIAVVLIIIAVMFTLISVPLSTQVQVRRTEDTRRQLETAKSALLGFAVANGRLPCPAQANSGGQESFCTAATGTCVGSETTTVQTHGNCSNFYNGFLPAVTLGLSPIDSAGFSRDAWETPANRVRYSVFDGTVGTATKALTSQIGMQTATIASLGTANYIYICKSGTGVTATLCAAAGSANDLSTRAAFLVYSLGQNASSPTSGTGTDESRNLDNNRVFVSHDMTAGANEFDDLLTWMPITLLINRMVDAQRLP